MSEQISTVFLKCPDRTITKKLINRFQLALCLKDSAKCLIKRNRLYCASSGKNVMCQTNRICNRVENICSLVSFLFVNGYSIVYSEAKKHLKTTPTLYNNVYNVQYLDKQVLYGMCLMPFDTGTRSRRT